MHKYGDGKRKQALSKVRVKVQPGGQHVPNLKVHARETGRVPVLLSATSLTTLGAVIIFETARTIFRKFEPKTVVQLELNPTGHWWMDLLEQMRVIIHDLETLFGQPNRGANGGSALEDTTEQVLDNHPESLCTSTYSRNHPTSAILSSSTTDAPDNTTESRILCHGSPQEIRQFSLWRWLC